MKEDKKKLIRFLKTQPYKLAHKLGFTKLNELNNQWIIDMVFGKEDETLQAHRNSYKTTCVSIGLALLMILYPNDKIMFMRKTDTDVKEIGEQVRKILLTNIFGTIVFMLYGVKLKLTTDSANAISTNLVTDPRGTEQLTLRGINGSLTGKHFDRIFTDDIVNIEDRYSKAEREFTKRIYRELANVLNRGGRMYNTGTPWHEQDCFTIMPHPTKHDCYSTGIMSLEDINQKKKELTASEFAANYELKHIASEDAIFTTQRPIFTGKEPLANGVIHLDVAFGGADANTVTLSRYDATTNILYILGKYRKGHIKHHLDYFIDLAREFDMQKAFLEDNADKGGTRANIKSKGFPCAGYHEKQNKNQKIRQYGYGRWELIQFHEDTDQEYINEIMNYNDQAEHDDAPDSLATSCRYWNKVISKYNKLLGGDNDVQHSNISE